MSSQKIQLSNQTKRFGNSFKTLYKSFCGAFIGCLGLPIYAQDIESVHHSNTLLQTQLEKMGYRDVSISACWLQFSRTITPSQNNGWTESYTRFENLDYLLGFSDSEIKEITRTDSTFYGISVRTDSNARVRPLYRMQFKEWVDTTYQGSNWPYIGTPEQQKATPEVERALREHFPNIDQLNRWVSFSKYGQSTSLSDWFQMTSPTREALVKFKSAIKSYAFEQGCNIER